MGLRKKWWRGWRKMADLARLSESDKLILFLLFPFWWGTRRGGAVKAHGTNIY